MENSFFEKKIKEKEYLPNKPGMNNHIQISDTNL